MSGGVINDYACPDCGYDGPHHVHSDDGDLMIVECAEFHWETTAEYDARRMVNK